MLVCVEVAPDDGKFFWGPPPPLLVLATLLAVNLLGGITNEFSFLAKAEKTFVARLKLQT